MKADYRQLATDSMTPDRGYDFPIDNVRALIESLLPNNTAQALKPPDAAGSED
jgi:hypothetical protein